MITLNGTNLGSRQKDLNEKVNQAVKSKVSFDTIEHEPEKNETDVDILFKIDLAAKTKNIVYILKIFKSGDNLYISRALKKCSWLGDKEFAIIIDNNNLQEHIYPHMSIRMKKKLLCALSVYVMDENRATAFHEYCMKVSLYNAALKFLLKTSESYKRDAILQKTKAFNLLIHNNDKLLYFIGNSFTIADVYLQYLENAQSRRNDVVYMLRHMYSLSETQYLDLLEKYTCYEYREPFRLGSKLSTKIMKLHKDRVLKNPRLYVNILKKNTISSKSTANDVKVYAVELLPKEASLFWSTNFYETYKFILNIIPASERFSYIKQIFTQKYPNEPFETCLNFHSYSFYNMMTTEEKEDWALQLLASDEEWFGIGNDYIWYKFVKFQKAFDEIKKFILITPDNQTRVEMLKVLIDSAKTQNDLETLLNYYYNRHVNEVKNYKEDFLNKLVSQHNVFNFNEECWVTLEKIFYSLDVFNKLNYRNCSSHYRIIALIYYILRKDTVLEVLNEYIDMEVIPIYQMRSLSCDLGAEKEEIIFQYFLQFYLTKVEALSKETFNDIIKLELHRYIFLFLDLISCYSKNKDSIPELMNTFIKLDWNAFKYNKLFYESFDEFSSKDIMRCMKIDATEVIKEFPKIKKYVESGNHTNWLIQKLKIYFHHDIAHQYLQLVNDCLSPDSLTYPLVKCSVYAVFKLADESVKVEFMEKHDPTSAKIDHGTISQKHLNIQQAICSQACVSRPRLPMTNVLRFITGDYVKYCLPIFNFYLMNLPIPQCITFVESLINKPVSIQKHGLRLAFECFSTENLAKLIKDIWKKSKNVSMRNIIYKALFDKVVKETGQKQLELFEVLKTLTLDLNQDDDPEVFELLTDQTMTYDLKGHHLVCAWEAVKRFPKRTINFKRMTNVISAIEQWLHMVPEDVLTDITDEHVSNMLDEKQILKSKVKNGQDQLNDAKWKLTDRYLTYVYNKEQIKRNLEVIKHITKRVLEMWNELRNDKYILREFCSSFLITGLEAKSYAVHAVESYSNVNIMYKTILKMLQDALPEQETYLLTWQVRISDIARKIIIAGKQEFKNEQDKDEVSKAIKTSVLRYAEAFGSLVKEYIRSGKYFISFHEQIESCLAEKLSYINRKIDVFNKINYNSDDLHIIMCTGLLKYKIPEMYMLILRVLPQNYCDGFNNPSLVKDYEKVIRMVKTLKDNEVQCFLYKKFVLSDYQFRKYVLC